MNRAYLAAPIFTEQQLAIVEAIQERLDGYGFEVFNPYTESRDIWKGRKPADCTAEERKRVLKGNTNAIEAAHIMVAWVGGRPDGNTDTGVTWEMGYAAGLRLLDVGSLAPVQIAYLDPSDIRKGMNLMLAGTVDAAVYGMEQLDAALHMASDKVYDELRERFDPEHILPQEGSK